MAIGHLRNSLLQVASSPGLRCDTHHIYHFLQWESFYKKVDKLEWVSLGSLVENIRNGLNLGTEYYSIEPTEYIYLSVSQISAYGFEEKNLTYLRDDVASHSSFFTVDERTILITRSGTVGVAMSGDHPSLDEAYIYVPSGFVITACVRPEIEISPRNLAGYLNIPHVQSLIKSTAAGGNQKNISQDIFKKVPVPRALLADDSQLLTIIDKFNALSEEFKAERSKLEDRVDNEARRVAEDFEAALLALNPKVD